MISTSVSNLLIRRIDQDRSFCFSLFRSNPKLAAIPFRHVFKDLISFVMISCSLKDSFHFVCSSRFSGMSPHLLCLSRIARKATADCQKLAVDDYSVALGRLEAGATSSFDPSGLCFSDIQIVFLGYHLAYCQDSETAGSISVRYCDRIHCPDR